MEGFSGSRIGREYPDSAEVLALIEVSILLLNGVLGIYLDKVLKKFKMDQAKKGFLPMLQGV